MRGYSREFLLSAFISRYVACSKITPEELQNMEKMAADLYDRVGRDSFRVYAALDAEAIRVYKNSLV